MAFNIHGLRLVNTFDDVEEYIRDQEGKRFAAEGWQPPQITTLLCIFMEGVLRRLEALEEQSD